MNGIVFTFRVEQDAVSGERKLLDAGVNVEMIPAPAAVSPGCRLCLKVNSGDADRARLLLGERIRGVFRESETGRSFAPLYPWAKASAASL